MLSYLPTPLSRPRLALETNHIDVLSSLHVTNLDNPSNSGKQRSQYASYEQQQSPMYHSNQNHPNPSGGNGNYPYSRYEPSPSSSPQQPARAAISSSRPTPSFPQPLSAPHSQPSFADSASGRFSSDRPPPYPDSPSAPSLDRRMSEPALLSGSHPAAYRSIDQSNRYYMSYASSSTYSPPDLHYQISRSHAEHSRNDSNGSSIGQQSYSAGHRPWSTDIKQEGGTYPEPSNNSNYSPRPSTGSTGVVDNTSPLPAYSIPAQSPTSANSISPDLSAQTPADNSQTEYPPHSPSGTNKTYAFVSLPGTTIRKRPRRRYDEIERLYHCSWPDCTKAYGTLNHLNAHVVMQKHGARRLPAEFKELRKQWRKAKKDGTFTPLSTNSSSHTTTAPASGLHPPSSAYYHHNQSASPPNERRRRLTDPNLPAASTYRAPNPYNSSLSSAAPGQSWPDDPSNLADRRYSMSMPYPAGGDPAVSDNVYGGYTHALPPQGSDTIGGYSSSNVVQQGYQITSSDQSAGYSQGHNYTYGLPSPVTQSHQHQSSASPTSPPVHRPPQRLFGSSTALPPLQPQPTPSVAAPSGVPVNRLPPDSTLLAPLDYRLPGSVVGGDRGESHQEDTRSVGSAYEEARGYDVQTQPQHQAYSYDSSYENETGSSDGAYSLGRNRLPRDSTLLTPLNLDHMRYGSGKGL